MIRDGTFTDAKSTAAYAGRVDGWVGQVARVYAVARSPGRVKARSCGWCRRVRRSRCVRGGWSRCRCRRGALVGPAGEGLGAVMSPAQRREVLWVGLAGRSAFVGRDVGLDVVEVGFRASRPHQGKTQCRSRRITCSRIHGGGSCWSTASVWLRSRTGWILALESFSQARMRSRVAGPSFSTSPTPGRRRGGWRGRPGRRARRGWSAPAAGRPAPSDVSSVSSRAPWRAAMMPRALALRVS